MHTLPERAPISAFDLRRHVRKTGARRKLGNNTPARLDDPQSIWIVMNGTVNVFAVSLDDAVSHRPREFLFSAEPGQLLFGFPTVDTVPKLSIIAVGDADTVVACVSEEQLSDAWQTAPEYAAALFTNYLQVAGAAVELSMSPGEPGEWATWIRAAQERFVQAAAELLVQRDAAVVTRLSARRTRDEATTSRALGVIGTLLDRRGRRDTVGALSHLGEALAIIGDTIGVRFREQVTETNVRDLAEQARHIASLSGVGCRQVRLTDEWWTGDAGALLAFIQRALPPHASPSSDLVPVALLPTVGGYEIVDPTAGTRSLVTANTVASFTPYALQFYRGLPAVANGTRAVRDFIVQGIRPELPTLVKASVAASCVALVPPFLTQSLVDRVIPSADTSTLNTVLIAMLVASIAGVLFEYVRAVSVMRARTRLIHDVQLAVLDRLFRLPVSFFRNYAAGDLGKRATGIATLGKDIGQYAVAAVFSGVAALSALGLLFWYHVPLALLCVLLLGVNVYATVFTSRRSLQLAREKQAAAGALSAFVLETLQGIAKLRVAAAESRVLARWSTPFAREQRAAFAFGLNATHLSAFHAALDVIARLALFASYAATWPDHGTPVAVGTFVAFAAAEGTLRAAVATATPTVMAILEQFPAWERMEPILRAVPESRADLPDPGVLSGQIQLRHVSFTYGADSPPVLHNVSLDIRSGQFVAIVGPSGSGKSTLLRLLLGFDEPSSGSILYDGQDLRVIDRIAVRRQIGVVLQNAALSNGDIYSNITGSTPRPQAVVWEAARLAGIDHEIAAMPMQLLTLVPDGGSSLSGGQRQRLLIARALINRPSMLFLDEATSALDTRAQRHVSESIDTLKVTRVVIAHRLSTIRHADQIVVLDGGHIVDTGTYGELVARGGLFSRLAAQQET